MPFLSPRAILISVIILFIASSLGIASCNKKKSFKKDTKVYVEASDENDEKAKRDVRDLINFFAWRKAQNEKIVPKKIIAKEEKEIKKEEGRALYFQILRKLKR